MWSPKCSRAGRHSRRLPTASRAMARQVGTRGANEARRAERFSSCYSANSYGCVMTPRALPYLCTATYACPPGVRRSDGVVRDSAARQSAHCRATTTPSPTRGDICPSVLRSTSSTSNVSNYKSRQSLTTSNADSVGKMTFSASAACAH